MKKILILFSVLLFIPLLSFAESPDPIVGCWYLYYDSLKTPEMYSAFPDKDNALSVYYFNSDGSIYVLNADVSDNKCTPSYGFSGKWQNINGLYVVSMIGSGKTTALVNDDELLLKILDVDDYYVRYKKLLYFDPYMDYVKK